MHVSIDVDDKVRSCCRIRTCNRTAHRVHHTHERRSVIKRSKNATSHSLRCHHRSEESHNRRVCDLNRKSAWIIKTLRYVGRKNERPHCAMLVKENHRTHVALDETNLVCGESSGPMAKGITYIVLPFIQLLAVKKKNLRVFLLYPTIVSNLFDIRRIFAQNFEMATYSVIISHASIIPQLSAHFPLRFG